MAVHLRLKLLVSEDDPTVDTVSDIWPTADWHEREIYDMMGLRFNNHPDLRRILMWEGYPYFPLRKEFPLEGLPSDMPDVAFTVRAPLEGGPFVTNPAPRRPKIASRERADRLTRPFSQRQERDGEKPGKFFRGGLACGQDIRMAELLIASGGGPIR